MSLTAEKYQLSSFLTIHSQIWIYILQVSESSFYSSQNWHTSTALRIAKFVRHLADICTVFWPFLLIR